MLKNLNEIVCNKKGITDISLNFNVCKNLILNNTKLIDDVKEKWNSKIGVWVIKVTVETSLHYYFGADANLIQLSNRHVYYIQDAL